MLINSVADHVHVLVNMGRTVSLAQVVEDVKKASSKWIKTQGPGLDSFAWQASLERVPMPKPSAPRA